MIIGLSLLHASGVEARHVCSVSSAATGEISLNRLVRLFKNKRSKSYVAALEVAGEVEFARRSGRHADCNGIQLGGRLEAERGLHHEALAVVEVHARERVPVHAVAGGCPRSVAD